MFIGAVIMLAGVLTQASSTTLHVFLGARVISMMHIQKNHLYTYPPCLSRLRDGFFHQCCSIAHQRT
jgi:hypothetical protein